MAVTSGWDLGSEADREAGWGRTVPLGVAGVTRRGPLDERAAAPTTTTTRDAVLSPSPHASLD
jgi:hypothetical protein